MGDSWLDKGLGLTFKVNDKDISSVIGTGDEVCAITARHSDMLDEAMVEQYLPSRPWEVIATDVFEYKGDLYLVLVDYY